MVRATQAAKAVPYIDRGAATQAVLMSVYRTLRLRGLDLTKTIADAMQTYLKTGQPPCLPQRAIEHG